MIAHVAKWGHSLALRIPKGYARELSVDVGHTVDVAIDSGRLVITPVKDVPTYDLAELVAGITEENLHGETRTGASVGEEY